MRREPTDIIVGECRDSETMDAAIQAAISGHVLTTTIHANNVPLTMQRIASLCPPGERENLISAVAQSLRLIVNQRLARAADGRRTPLREFLVFDAELRGQFLRTDPSEWPALTSRAVEEKGQSYKMALSPTPWRRAASPRRLRRTNCGRSGDAWLFGGDGTSFAREPEMLPQNARKEPVSGFKVLSKALHAELRPRHNRRRAMDIERGASSQGFSGVMSRCGATPASPFVY